MPRHWRPAAPQSLVNTRQGWTHPEPRDVTTSCPTAEYSCHKHKKPEDIRDRKTYHTYIVLQTVKPLPKIPQSIVTRNNVPTNVWNECD